jgi:hypothetical protein
LGYKEGCDALIVPWTFEALGPGVHDVVDMKELVLDVFHPERWAWLSTQDTSSGIVRAASFMVTDGNEST